MNKNRETLMKFISAQNQKVQDDISKQGYKDNSPYRDNPFNIIQGTPQGTSITMDGVSKRLYATDGQTSKILEPNSGQHFFSGPTVKEVALAKYGGLLNKTIKCSNCGWSWKAADGGNDVSTCHKCGAENKIMQEGGPTSNIKSWFAQQIQSPVYRRNLESSGYKDVDAEIAKRLSNIDKTKYIADENRLGTYYNPGSRYIHHAPLKDIENWEGNAPESESILAHEFGHSGVAKGPGTRLNKYDIEQLGSRNKNKKSYPQENYADQKALQYEAAKLGIYNPGTEEFTQEHLNKLKNTGHKSRALENYSDQDLIWLMNNIAQVDDQPQLPIAQMGGAGMMYADRNYQVGGTKKPIYVSSENDPRYKAYNDSLSLYKTSLKNMRAEKNRSNSKITKKGFIPFDEFNTFVPGSNLEYNDENMYPGENFEAWKKKSTVVSKTKLNNLIKNNIKPIGFDINEWRSDVKGKPTLNYSTVYKKPEQEVIFQKPQETQINLQPASIQSNLNITADMSGLRPQARIPKYFNVTDRVNQNFGGSETSYKYYPENGPLQELAPEPYNTRTMIPQYQTAGQVKYGTPEYTEAYNKGEVITDKGVRSPIALDEVVIQNNYKRPRGIWEQYADKIVEENKDASLLGAILGVPISAVTSVPQLMGMKALTGEMQRPSEGLKIKNSYGAMAVDAVTDPAAWFGASEVAALKTLTRENALAKLANIRNIKTSAAPELTEGLSQQGFTWSMNPLGKVFGEKLPEGWHRKMGSGKGIQSVIDNQGIVSPSNDHLFFAYGKKPNENYAGVFNTVVDKSKLADSEISGFSTFYGPRGRHKGVSPVTSKGKSMTNIPITDPALSIHRRLPFTNSYIPISKEAITSGPRTLKETLLVDPTLANFQKYGEDATKIALWLSAAQQVGHMGAGSNDKDKYPLGVPVLQRAYEASKEYVQPQLEKTADEFQKVLNSTQYTNGGLTKYQNAGPVKKWLGNTLTPEGYVTSTTKGGNYISFTGNDRADDWINKQIDSGKFGFDPKTGGTFPLKKPVKGLSKEDQFIGTKTFYDLQAPQGFTSESQDAQIKKLPEWQQDIIDTENTKRRKRVVKDQMDEVYKHPLWYAPGMVAAGIPAVAALEVAGAAAAPYITTALATQLPGMAAVPGATVGNAITAGFAGHGLANVGPDTIEMYKNPSWSNAGSLGMDVLEVAPIIGPAAKTISKGAAVRNAENAATEYANPIKDLAATFKNKNKKLITVGAENLDKELLKKITQLESPEGFNRLVAQEAEMLKRDFPGLADLENKAISNAQTRISELYQTALRGNFNANYLEAKKLNPALTPQKFGIPRNNAFFRPGLGSNNFSDGVIDLSKANSPAQLRNNIFAKEFYGVEMPGEIAIGREYAEGIPVYDHEINHLLQNTRNTALDDILRKYFNNSQNLLKDFSQKTNKAYNYFRKSKHGVPSKEPSSFLAEARRAMLERGLIKDIYEPITPKKVFDAMKHFKTQPYENPYTGQSYHRIFDFANDSPQTLKFLSDSFNKLPAILPVGLATGATGAAVLPTEKQGGTTSVKQKKALSWLSS